MKLGSSGTAGPARGLPRTDRSGVRIALYSHDTVGIGHIRRNLRIARTLAGGVDSGGILLISGAREAGLFSMPAGLDCLTLPSLKKEENGCYGSRSLGVSLEDLIRLRSASLAAALEAFAPDVLIVDKVPRGALGELDVALENLRRHGHTRCVLGLREILDDPATVHREWAKERAHEALREYYDAIWVYGDPRVYNLVAEYKLDAATSRKVSYAGYLDSAGADQAGTSETAESLAKSLGLPPGRLALCVLGGGQDGAALASAFCETTFPPDMNGVLVTGPFMPVESRKRLFEIAAARTRLRVLEFVDHPERLMQAADRVISMGGYNTVCEVLAAGKQSLIVPRVRPRREQFIRAERLRDLNFLDMLLPDELTPAALSEWLSRELPQRPVAREQIDFGGLARLPELLRELLAQDIPRVSDDQEELRLVAS